MRIGHTELDEALEQLGRLKGEIEKRESRERVTLEICQMTWDLCKKQWDLQFSSSNEVADFLRIFTDAKRLDFNVEHDQFLDTLFDAEVFMLTSARQPMDRMASAAVEG